MGQLALCAVLVATAACGEHARFTCITSAQCVLGGEQGTCEPDGHCSFPDATCPSGSRYEAQAGDGFGGQCVGDVAACGALDGACCEGGDACGPNLFCDGGVCRQCVVDVALGLSHSCFVKYDGTLWCSGYNDDGQLGDGTRSTMPVSTPVQVREVAGALTDVVAAVGGESYTCAIRAGGTVWCWGSNSNCAPKFGDGGQLGNGSDVAVSPLPVQVQVERSSPLTDIVELAADACRACARDASGGVWCWGYDEEDSLGDGSDVPFVRYAVPVQSSDSSGALSNAAALTSNGAHACVRTTNDEIWCWGGNFAGQIGNGDQQRANAPTAQYVFDAISVAAGRAHTCAVKADGSAWCWGSNRHGRLGNGQGDRGAGDPADRVLPVQVMTAHDSAIPLTGVASVAAGSSSCALMENKELLCWGVNHYGQIGTGAGTYVPAPVRLPDQTPLRNVERVVAAFHRTCAFTTDGALYCWGRNSEGQLGDGTFENRGWPTPIQLTCP